MTKLDPKKLIPFHTTEWNLVIESAQFSKVFHDGIEKLVFEGLDEVKIEPSSESDLPYSVKMFLDKKTSPPLIFIHIANQFAGNYIYRDQEFAKRGNTELGVYY
jgi:hypothetical protein